MMTIMRHFIDEKDKAIRVLDAAVGQSFGQDAFEARGERLGANHVVYRSRANQDVEISVVADEEETTNRYSVQVEVGMTEPDFAIPLVQEGLSLEEVLVVLDKCRHHA
jgi:hypothetical protein